MKVEEYSLYKNVPGMCEEVPKLTAYIPENKKSDGAVVILSGGAYFFRAEHEGKGYAEFLCENGICAFVADYRVSPHRFPLPLLDSRRAIQMVRYLSEKYGIDKDKVAIMGSSAGGHLAALTSTYFEEFEEYKTEDEISVESFIPNAQILCYPVIKLLGKGIAHLGSGKNLLGENQAELGEELSPDNIVSSKTPKAFIWHTFEDAGVNVINSLDYAKALKNNNIETEMHIYPNGPHGMGIPKGDSKVEKHVSSWADALIKWLAYIGF